MINASLAAKHLLITYSAIKAVRFTLQEKLRVMLCQCKYHDLIESDDRHPYFRLVEMGDRLVNEFAGLQIAISNQEMSGGTVSDVLDRIKAKHIGDKDTANDLELDELRAIAPDNNAVTASAAKLADELVQLLCEAHWVWSYADIGVLKDELVKSYGKKGAKNSIEKPVIETNKICRAAIKEIKKLIKVLLLHEVDGVLVKTAITEAMNSGTYDGLQMNGILKKILKN